MIALAPAPIVQFITHPPDIVQSARRAQSFSGCSSPGMRSNRNPYARGWGRNGPAFPCLVRGKIKRADEPAQARRTPRFARIRDESLAVGQPARGRSGALASELTYLKTKFNGRKRQRRMTRWLMLKHNRAADVDRQRVVGHCRSLIPNTRAYPLISVADSILARLRAPVSRTGFQRIPSPFCHQSELQSLFSLGA